MNEATDNRDPAQIERDIRRTQEDMSRTVDRIGDQLTPRNILNALLDKAESNDIDARSLLDGARRNPLALAMIAGGAIWLASDSDAKLPKMKRDKPPRQMTPKGDLHHRDYISHMQQIELREGEDPVTYQRRRDIARANFLMCERRHEEDDASFRQRLDELTERFREKRHDWATQASHAASGVSHSAQSTGRKAQQMFTDNPLVAGLAAAAVGAILGTIVPVTEIEEENLSGLGEKAREMAGEQKDKLTQAAREKKDELVHKVEETADRGGGNSPMVAPNTSTGVNQGVHANDQGRPNLQQAASQGQVGQQGSSGITSGQQGGPSSSDKGR